MGCFSLRRNSMDTGVIYARFGSHGQNEQSIEAQVRICKECAEKNNIKAEKNNIKAEKNNIKIVNVYFDEEIIYGEQ